MDFILNILAAIYENETTQNFVSHIEVGDY